MPIAACAFLMRPPTDLPAGAHGNDNRVTVVESPHRPVRRSRTPSWPQGIGSLRGLMRVSSTSATTATATACRWRCRPTGRCLCRLGCTSLCKRAGRSASCAARRHAEPVRRSRTPSSPKGVGSLRGLKRSRSQALRHANAVTQRHAVVVRLFSRNHSGQSVTTTPVSVARRIEGPRRAGCPPSATVRHDSGAGGGRERRAAPSLHSGCCCCSLRMPTPQKNPRMRGFWCDRVTGGE